MADVVVVGDNNTQAIVSTAAPIAITVDGTLKGDQGIQGIQGIQGNPGAPSTQITVANNAPIAPSLNDLWIDTSSQWYDQSMSDIIDMNGKSYEVSGYADDGLPIIKATAISESDGFDDDGNPRVSVRINVPVADLLGTPGKVQ